MNPIVAASLGRAMKLVVWPGLVYQMVTINVAWGDRQSMETVIRRLREIQGGVVYAIGREMIAEFPAPL